MQDKPVKISIDEWESMLWETKMSPHAKVVGLVLSTYYQAGKPCCPQLWEIAEKSSLSISRVKKAMEELKENNLIKVHTRNEEVTYYGD